MHTINETELPHAVLKQFRVIFGSVKDHFQRIREVCGISGSQLWLLQEIAQQPGIGVSELAQRLSIHQSTCSLLVDKMVSTKLTSKRRQPEDLRRVGLYITANGKKTLAMAPSPAKGLLPATLEQMPTDELAQLSCALKNLMTRLDLASDKLEKTPLADL